MVGEFDKTISDIEEMAELAGKTIKCLKIIVGVEFLVIVFLVVFFVI